jgi:hypothetical protein
VSELSLDTALCPCKYKAYSEILDEKIKRTKKEKHIPPDQPAFSRAEEFFYADGDVPFPLNLMFLLPTCLRAEKAQRFSTASSKLNNASHFTLRKEQKHSQNQKSFLVMVWLNPLRFFNDSHRSELNFFKPAGLIVLILSLFS